MNKRHILVCLWARTIFVSIVVSFCCLAGAQAQGEGDNYDALTAEQQELADEMLAFMDEMEAKFFAIAERFNGSAEAETRTFNDDKADRTVKVVRGEVIEKGGFTRDLTKAAFPPFLDETHWNRYLEIDFHTKTPLVGVLHLTMAFRFDKDGTSSVGGVMQVGPAARIEEDIVYMREKVDEVFGRHGVAVKPYRDQVCSGHRMERMNLACSGVSFYVNKPFDITMENYALVRDTFEGLLDAYVDVVDKRKDQSFTEEDLAAQDEMRRGWFEDHAFSDQLTVGFVPFEAWTFMHGPPTLKY